MANKALHLIYKKDKEWLLQLDVDIWERWACAVVAGLELDKTETGARLLFLTYDNAPVQLIQTILALMDGNYPSILWKIDLWDDAIEQALAAKCKDPSLSLYALKELLKVLLEHGCQDSIHFAESLVLLWDSTEGVEKEKAVIAAQSLVLYAPDAGWDVVWPVILKDDDFGKQVIDHLIQTEHIRDAKIATKISADQFADLYLWVERQYPNEGYDPPHGAVSPSNERWLWKSSVIGHLKNHGEVDAIERLINELPELAWLQNVLVEAQKVLLEQCWIPPTPDELLELMKDSRKRIIQSEEQLCDLVMGLLAELEARLHGETPEVANLWDHQLTKGWKPKDENHLSDHITRYFRDKLESSGVIINREVEIRRKTGDAQGQRTDIYIQTTAKDRSGRSNQISLVIEVKGNWNKDLDTAMKNQLADRYLSEFRCHTGIYLVGWFDSNDWIGGDKRRTAARRKSKDAATAILDHQAKELSRNGVSIRLFVLNASR